MGRRKLMGPPYLEYRFKGLQKWRVAWSLYDFDTGQFIDRYKPFFTQWGARRWIEKQRITPEKTWNRLDEA